MKRNITFILLIFLFSSCATMMNGPTQMVFFNSHPLGAKITIDGVDYGTTPKTIELRRDCESSYKKGKTDYKIVIEMEGYLPYEMVLTRKVDVETFVLGNIIIGGVIGMMIDAGTGAMYKLDQQYINANMNKLAVHNISDESIYFDVSLKPDLYWEKIGQLTRK